MNNLIKDYFRKHGVTLYKAGYHLRAFQVIYSNARERGDLRSLLYLGWMILYGQGCCQSYKLSVQIFKEVMERKGTVEADEASKLLAVVYILDKVKYGDKNWAGWTLAGSHLLDLRTEEGF